MNLNGYFINLDRSPDRREFMQNQLIACGSDAFIKRFSAIDGATLDAFDTPAESRIRACRASHTKAILDSDPLSTTVILEDDAELSAQFADVVTTPVLMAIERSNPDMDMLFLDCHPNRHYLATLLSLAELHMPNRARPDRDEKSRYRLSNMAIVDASGIYNACTTAYVVTPKGKRTLRALFEAEDNPSRPVDFLYLDWIKSGAVKARIGVPFVATPAFLQSTIGYSQTEQVAAELRLAHVGRRLLFAGNSNVNADDLESLLTDIPMSPEYELGMRVFNQLWARPVNP